MRCAGEEERLRPALRVRGEIQQPATCEGERREKTSLRKGAPIIKLRNYQSLERVNNLQSKGLRKGKLFKGRVFAPRKVGGNRGEVNS